MSDTLVDMAKVTQALDAGWYLGIHKNPLGSYTAIAQRDGIRVVTDDFTPEQALTRMAYKVHGEII